MRALLDTHALLWLADDPGRLPGRVVEICENDGNELFVSIATFWELAIKMSLGKIELTDDGLERLAAWCEDNSITMLPIALAHCTRVRALEFVHRDPFDRLLIAQALTEELALISVDGHFAAYGVSAIWD